MAEKTAQNARPIPNPIPAETRAHMRAARQEFRDSLQSFLPPQFLEHHRNARKEMLLAWRSLIDTSLQHMEEHEKKAK